MNIMHQEGNAMKRYPLNFGWKRKYVDDQLPLAFDGGGGKNVNLPDDFIITLPRKADADWICILMATRHMWQI